MRNKILTIIAVALMSLYSNAQEGGLFELSINGGLNISTVTNSVESTRPRIGFNTTVGAEYHISDLWGIKARVVLDQKGWADGFIFDGFNSIDTDFRLTYTTIPVTGVIHFGRSDNWYAHFGPYVGFLNKATADINNSDVSDSFRPIDFGLNVGLGVRIPLSDELKVFFEYDSQSGLNEIFEENQDDWIRNARSSINVGLVYAL